LRDAPPRFAFLDLPPSISRIGLTKIMQQRWPRQQRAVANYKKALAVGFHSIVRVVHKSLLWDGSIRGARSHVPRLKISHCLFATCCVAAIIDRG
jgi:hypothetical protein